mmetsp:Transcript_5948/g.12380  ORF Transcript_5948/g.12380 Transcript_5948/m.12380 type:complete len:234 (+) Transcript_5948:103-804(+)
MTISSTIAKTAQNLVRVFTTMTSACALTRVSVYKIQRPNHSFNFVISRGSVVDFSHPDNPRSCAIVNAANEECLCGGGVDGAISNAGGPNLFEDRYALPVVGFNIRCPTGSAVITGPNAYHKLHVPYVIHAVGPNYVYMSTDLSQGDELLASAYTSSLARGKEAKLEAIAFSLLSAGVFRGPKTLKDVLRIGVNAICNFDGYEGLMEVHMCAFSQNEEDALKEIANNLGLKAC